MSLSGSLEDVTVADVFQFVHLGHSTGTLRLKNGSSIAEIGFHDGEIVSAGSTNGPRIGELLISRGVISRDELDQAILRKQKQRRPMPIGELLVEEGVLPAEELRRALVKQIKDTIVQIIRWRGGVFEFRRGTPRGVQENTSPEARARLTEVKINTERILLEVAQLLDESAAAQDTAPGSQDSDASQGDWGEEASGWVAEDLFPENESNTLSEHGIELLSHDEDLASGLAVRCTGDPQGATMIQAVGRPWRVIDLRPGHFHLDDIDRVMRRDQETPVVAIAEDPVLAARCYQAGARAVLPPDAALIWPALVGLSRGYRIDHPSTENLYGALARLRRVMSDIRSGVMSTTVALTLMDFVGENVERAIIFLARQNVLMAIGAFGFGKNGRPLAESSRHFEFPRDGEDALAQTASDGQLRDLTWEDAILPESLRAALGPPRFDQLVVLPVMGTHRVLAVIYADNGDIKAPLKDVELLEIAGAQVGTALENELLRRQLTADRMPLPETVS